jgi:replicative DNA helicase
MADEPPPNMGDDAPRALPSNVEAEQALLGALLVDNDVADKVASFLGAKHFFEPVHGRVYAAAMSQIDRGRKVTPVTLSAFFEMDDSLADVGGSEYLARLMGAAVTVDHAEDYGREILSAYARREVIKRCDAIAEMAWAPKIDDTADLYVTALNEVVDDLSAEAVGESMVSMGEAVEAAAHNAEEAAKHGRIIGATTGMACLDRAIGGFEDGQFIIVAGATSMGKTQLAMVLAHNAATDAKDPRPVCYFSLEMENAQLGARQLARQSGIDLRRIRMGQVTTADNIFDAVKASAGTPVWIDDTSDLTVAQMYARCRKMRREHGLGLVVVDFLQLIKASKTYRGNKTAEVGQIAKDLKNLAKDLKVPVVAASQLRRPDQNRKDMRPTMSDLKESGDIENAADIILLLYRHHYFHPEKPSDAEEGYLWDKHVDRMEVIISKQRQGARGMTVPLYYQETTGRITDPDYRDGQQDLEGL